MKDVSSKGLAIFGKTGKTANVWDVSIPNSTFNESMTLGTPVSCMGMNP